VTGLQKTFGRRRVVDGVDYQVEPGEIVGLLGPNGAGKTTCFRMTCGMIEPDRGKVFLSGVDVTAWPMYRRARDGGMGYLAQESSVFRKLSVEQNLLGVMEMLGMSRKVRRRRCDELLDQFQIAHLRKSRASKLSGGERRRLEIARCLVSDPEIILLDEPFAGIDPVTVQSIQEIVRELRNRNIAILITDHAARETLQITDRSCVISAGRGAGGPQGARQILRRGHRVGLIGPCPGVTRLRSRRRQLEAPRHARASAIVRFVLRCRCARSRKRGCESIMGSTLRAVTVKDSRLAL
jgi:lipopolysaccharide export system ATP-binding protein